MAVGIETEKCCFILYGDEACCNLVCKEACPAKAIYCKDSLYIENEKCVWCCNCIGACPNGALHLL
ncbi:MAG: hypothetical protein ACXQTP_02560 [Candidatus Methanofastidiosia archaeon]